MQRLMRGAALVSVLVLLGACSGDGSDDAPAHRSSTTAIHDGTDATRPIARPPAPSVAQADGWRLGVSQPTDGATIGQPTELCYELSGPTREPVAALDVSLLSSGASAASPLRIAATVGRASATLQLREAVPGIYDLEVQLIANGERVDGVAVMIRNVALAPGTPTVACR